MKKLILPLMFFILTCCLAGCYYDSEEALFGKPSTTTVCNTDSTKFVADIKPILQSNCLACHSNLAAPSNGAGIRLQDYADVKTYVGRLMGTIQHTSGYSPMPKGGIKLSDCNISMIQAWITKGSLNN